MIELDGTYAYDITFQHVTKPLPFIAFQGYGELSTLGNAIPHLADDTPMIDRHNADFDISNGNIYVIRQMFSCFTFWNQAFAFSRMADDISNFKRTRLLKTYTRLQMVEEWWLLRPLKSSLISLWMSTTLQMMDGQLKEDIHHKSMHISVNSCVHIIDTACLTPT